MDNTLGVLIIVAMLGIGLFGGYVIGDQKVEIVEIEKPVVTEKVIEIEKDCPTCPTCPEVIIPKTDDDLRDDFYRDYFEEDYTEIENEAEAYALEELEDEEYEVVVEYLKTLLSENEELEEDSVDVEIIDTNIKVTQLGLGEDEDKSATVEFELKVKYKLEEGETTRFKKNIDVLYDVVFDEGEFDDEEVELISIL
jgi:hypothetical protein